MTLDPEVRAKWLEKVEKMGNFYEQVLGMPGALSNIQAPNAPGAQGLSGSALEGLSNR